MKKEHFEELNQLDRIEYTLEKRELDRNWNWSLICLVSDFMFKILTMILLVFILAFQFGKGSETYINLISIFPTLIYILKLFIIVSIILKIISIIISIYESKKLNEKFLDIKVTPKKKK